MLSRENRNNLDAYGFREGMRNVVYLCGFARFMTKRSGYIQQTRNENHFIPFVLKDRDTMPKVAKEGAFVKVMAHVIGAKLPSGHRICVLRTFHIEEADVLDAPPESVWDIQPPQGAPVSDFRPKFGKGGVELSSRSNMVHIAGFVGGLLFERKGKIKEDGTPRSNDCLRVLIRQTEKDEEAIPVKIYGSAAGPQARVLKLGQPVYVRFSKIEIDVKKTGKVGDDGIDEVMKYPQLKTTEIIKHADRDVITRVPNWAIQLAMDGREQGRTSVAEAKVNLPEIVEGSVDAAPTAGQASEEDVGVGEEQMADLLKAVSGRPVEATT
jgi:hypothetical protein